LKALGYHILLEFYNCDKKALNSRKHVESALMEAARRSKAHIVQSVFHQFNPHGVSGVVVISESHFSVHTWPEYGYAAIDLFSCGESIDYKAAMKVLTEKLKSKHVTSIALQRGLLGIPKCAIR
jgi:S-adenosylmethionine decarboxylase